MKTYSYEALTKDGSVVKGSMDSGNERLVIDQLQGMGYYPLRISGKDEDTNLFSLFKVFENKVREKDIMSLSYQLSVLFEAGFPLDRSLSIMAELTEKKKLKEIIKELLSGIRSGKSFSDALSMFPETFPLFYINMVKAGEAGGFLEDALKRLSGYLEYSQKLKEDVRSALI
ncbi:MAG: type II secretion system protein GspF, partial [Nitrospirae bacterium]|nr:type II secretion system protein GspF [Nitrospirota bacterium]